MFVNTFYLQFDYTDCVVLHTTKNMLQRNVLFFFAESDNLSTSAERDR